MCIIGMAGISDLMPRVLLSPVQCKAIYPPRHGLSSSWEPPADCGWVSECGHVRRVAIEDLLRDLAHQEYTHGGLLCYITAMAINQ